ncbi:MAG: sigma 54-interacting transcriptional regulator [Bilophila sp.]
MRHAQPFAVASDEDFDRLMENPLFRRFLDTLSIGVSVTDPTGTIRYFPGPVTASTGSILPSVVGRKMTRCLDRRARGAGLPEKQAINTLNSIMFNGVEGICRRYPILDDAGNLLCCLSEVITTTYEKKRIDELLLDIQRLKQKVGYIVSEENPGRSLCSFDDLVGESAVMQSLKVMGRRFARSREPVLHPRGERHGQGIVRAGRASGEPPRRGCLRLGELRGASPRAGGVGTLRLCGGGVYGGAQGRPEGEIRACGQGHNLSGRNRGAPLYLQAKLLRVLESCEIQKLGAPSGGRSDFRLIAATNRNLPDLVAEGTFREDLPPPEHP